MSHDDEGTHASTMSDLRGPNYLAWLGLQVVPEGRKEYTQLMVLLQAKEFVWFVPNDDNRMEDGMELRREYFNHRNPFPDAGCTVLEMIVALSRRFAFWMDDEPQHRAWEMIRNLELHKYHDPLSKRKIEQVDEILECLVFRNYNEDGTGGLFPLAWPKEDQRKIEIWYQMSAYVNEMNEF